MRREVHDYFMSINIPLMELYGMSESSGPHTLNLMQPDRWRVGSCGKTIEGVQLKIFNPDENGEGEVSYRWSYKLTYTNLYARGYVAIV